MVGIGWIKSRQLGINWPIKKRERCRHIGRNIRFDHLRIENNRGRGRMEIIGIIGLGIVGLVLIMEIWVVYKGFKRR